VRKVSEIEIYRSSNDIVEIYENENSLTIEHRWYPIKGYGNKVVWTIEFDKNKHSITAAQCNYSWNGTGCKDLAFVRFSDDEFAELLNTARSIKSVEDFDFMLKRLREIEEEADNEVNSKISELIEKLQQIQQLKDILTAMSEQELVSEIKQYLLERFSE
jgi:hypothetical protein